LTLFTSAAVSIAIPKGTVVTAAAIAEPDPVRRAAWLRVFPSPLTRDYMHSLAILDATMVDVPDLERAPAHLTVGARNFRGATS
jgi:hypothetical protein